MVERRSMNKCVIFVALVACHAILSAEGRQLKYKEKEETAEPGSKSINLQQNAAGIKEDFKSAKPRADIPRAANTVSVAGKNEIIPPSSFGDSATVYEDDFRPTTPGNSPGVGHKHAKEEEVDSKVKDDDSYDQSLGTGHLPSNRSAEPKA